MPEVEATFSLSTILTWVFLISSFIFILYGATVAFHLFRYGTSKVISLFGTFLYIGVGLVLLLVMASTIN
ncbi:hypothetical protein CL653_02505 [bacterium]|nr:hypothetical protein [bacterium]